MDWVGTSKECKNSMHDYLTEGTEPEFKEPEEPTPAREGDPISKPQMEKYSIKLRKYLSDEEDWEESKGRLFRTIVQLCTIALQNKLESEVEHSDLKRKCDVNGSLELIMELVHSTNHSQETILKMVNGMVTLHCTGHMVKALPNIASGSFQRSSSLKVNLVS